MIIHEHVDSKRAAKQLAKKKYTQGRWIGISPGYYEHGLQLLLQETRGKYHQKNFLVVQFPTMYMLREILVTAQQVTAIENTSTGKLSFMLYSHLKFQYHKKTKYLPEDSHEGINSAFFLQMFHQYHLA